MFRRELGKEILASAVLKVLEEAGGPLKFKEIRDRLKPKFVPNLYPATSFNVILANVLGELCRDGIIDKIKYTREDVKKNLRRQIFYVTKDRLKSYALQYLNKVITEEEYLDKITKQLDMLYKQGKREEFLTLFYSHFDIIDMIKSDFTTEWIQHIEEKYFKFESNPLTIYRRFERLHYDLESLILKWNGILWRYKEVLKPQTREIVKKMIKTLTEIERELYRWLGIIGFVSEVGWDEKFLIKFSEIFKGSIDSLIQKIKEYERLTVELHTIIS